MRSRMKLPAAGFTLVELAVVLAILAPVLGIVLSGVSTVVETSVDATVQVDAQQRVIFTTKKLRKDLGRAQIQSITPDGLSVTFKHPLDMTGSGALVDTSGNVQWGAVEPTSVPAPNDGPNAASSYTIQFVVDDAVDEAVLGKDLNRDGDMVDTFQLGHLERRTTLSPPVLMSPSSFLVDANVPNGDLNGDGIADPMFSWALGDPVTINLLTRVRRRNAEAGSTFKTIRIFLSNMATE